MFLDLYPKWYLHTLNLGQYVDLQPKLCKKKCFVMYITLQLTLSILYLDVESHFFCNFYSHKPLVLESIASHS